MVVKTYKNDSVRSLIFVAISLYTGFVGSGKSYHAVDKAVSIAEAPAGKRWVVANFPITKKKKFIARLPFLGKKIKDPYIQSRLYYHDNDVITPEYIIKK